MFKEDLKQLIRSAHPYLEQFDYDHYPEQFASFEASLMLLLREAQDEHAADTAAAAQEVVDAFSEDYSRLPWWQRGVTSSRDKRVLALFLTPAALRAGGYAADLAEQLRGCWNRRYPREPYLAGEYETIMKGFDANLLGLPLRKSSKR